jgi:hypothetical protein
MGLARRLCGRRTDDEHGGPGRLQRGVTLVEYALVVTFLVAGSAVAVNYLRTGVSDEVDNQADCIASDLHVDDGGPDHHDASWFDDIDHRVRGRAGRSAVPDDHDNPASADDHVGYGGLDSDRTEHQLGDRSRRR